jgi:uncharacterized membrane protein YfcA
VTTRADGGGGEAEAAARPGTPAGYDRLWRLAVIGLAAGLFSALFGVGGGIVVVPLLISLLAYDAKIATATSLAGIIFTSAFSTAAHGALGNVQWAKAVLIGVPAMGGLLLGLWLKDRLSSRTLTYAFAALLVAVAIDLVVTA